MLTKELLWEMTRSDHGLVGGEMVGGGGAESHIGGLHNISCPGGRGIIPTSEINSQWLPKAPLT